MFPCRIDITEIPMKECSAYGEVSCDKAIQSTHHICLATRRDNSSTRWPGSVGSDRDCSSVGCRCVHSHGGCCCCIVYRHLVQEVNKQPLLSSWAILGVYRVIVYHAGLHPRQEVNSRGKCNHIQFLLEVYVMCHKHCVSCLLCAVCTQHALNQQKGKLWIDLLVCWKIKSITLICCTAACKFTCNVPTSILWTVFMFSCRFTDITLKECPAYKEVGNDGDQRVEPQVYDLCTVTNKQVCSSSWNHCS